MTALSQSDSVPSSTIRFCPSDIAVRQTAYWRGLRAEIVQVTRPEPFEYYFRGPDHLLIALELAEREDGETLVDGALKSNLHKYSGKLLFVPAGHELRGSQKPRVLTRSICLYIDPQGPLMPPQTHFDEAVFEPRLYFEDSDLWETAQKLKRQVQRPTTPLHAEALGAVLAYELLQMERDGLPDPREVKGGLAAWQKKRLADYIEQHLAERISIVTLADLVGLSPYHFARAFKQSFGVPPHRYQMMGRIEYAKVLLARPGASVTDTALNTGFSDTSAFSEAFRRFTLKTPSEYRRSLE